MSTEIYILVNEDLDKFNFTHNPFTVILSRAKDLSMLKDLLWLLFGKMPQRRAARLGLLPDVSITKLNL